jgi:hypothetical protein
MSIKPADPQTIVVRNYKWNNDGENQNFYLEMKYRKFLEWSKQGITKRYLHIL